MTQPFTVVIPARYASTRLPGKIIKPLAGKPMVQWVYEQALGSGARSVVIAADDEKIAQAVSPFNSEVVMTSPDHESGTDRLEEVARQLELPGDAIIVNVQGDEPLMPPMVIDQVAENLAGDHQASAATLCEALTSADELRNPNVVKVVPDSRQRALYFSRAPIPWPRDEMASGTVSAESLRYCFRHIGIYAYRVDLLHQFVRWPTAPLEALEKLEQLRIMYNGAEIHVAEAAAPVPAGVDTEEDWQRVEAFLGGESHG